MPRFKGKLKYLQWKIWEFDNIEANSPKEAMDYIDKFGGQVADCEGYEDIEADQATIYDIEEVK